MRDFLPGLEGIVATKSAISCVDGEQGLLSYRGYPIEALADNSSFEETSLLLLRGELPPQDTLDDFTHKLRSHYHTNHYIADMMRHCPPKGHPMAVLQMAVASLGMSYTGSDHLTTGDSDKCLNYINDMTVNIIASMPYLAAMWQHIRSGNDPIVPRTDLSIAKNLIYMFTGDVPDQLLANIMDVCLILHAEHTLNASTFSALVSGSTLANPYSVIASAIGTLSGPLHGGANSRVVTMLKEIGSPDNADKWIDNALANKEIIWGMGHREYKVKDPRATILHKLVLALIDERGCHLDEMFATALQVESICADRLGHKGVYPNVDFYSGILYAQMGIPADQFTTLFAVARAAGWLAHWHEQIADNRIYRPTQIYTGKKLRKYIPLSERN